MAAMLIVIASVAALTNDLSHAVYYSMNPLNPDKGRELEGKYGKWAVKLATAACPFDDIECIEREAKRLSEARLRR